MMVLPRWLKKKVRKTLVFFVKFAKRLITMQKNVGTKTSPNVTFVKSLAMLKRIVAQETGAIKFCEKTGGRKGRKPFLFF